MNNLDKYRQEIDQIDQELMELLSKRYALSLKVRDYKKVNKVAVLDNTREQSIYQNIKDFECDEQFKLKIKEVYDTLLKTSRQLQE